MATPIPQPAFVDSNLDTHLAIIVSTNDTVSDLKEKIEKEHQRCFPQLGKIKVQSVKVKRKGYYYHLSDTMTVQSAFYGISNWFLCVDVSSAAEHNQNHHSYNRDCGNLLTNYDSAALVNGVDLGSGLCSKRSPSLDETQLLLDANEQFVKAKAFSASETSLAMAEKVTLEIKRVEGEHLIDNVYDATSPDLNNREDLGIPIVCGPCGGEPEVPNTLSTLIEVTCGRKREDAESNESLDDRVSGKKKRKRRKGMKELMDDNDNSICESGIDISQQDVIVADTSKNEACGEGSEKISQGIKTIANESCQSSSCDTPKGSSCRFQSNNICERTENPDELVVSKSYDLLSENPIRNSQYSPASKKAKRGNNVVEEEECLKSNGVLVSEFNEESATHKTISEQSLGSNKCSVKTVLDSLSENVFQSGTSSSSGKKKKKKTKHRPSNLSSKVAVAISSPSKDNKGEISSSTTGIQMEVTREADGIDNIPGHNITQDAALSSFPRVSAPEMHYGSASSIRSSVDVNVRNSNIDNGERIRDALEKEAVFGIERTINAKDNQIIDAKGETNQTDQVTEDVMSSQICDKPLPLQKCISSGPNEADMIVNEVITSLDLLNTKKIDRANSDKKKKRKKSKTCGQHPPFEAVIEDAKGIEHEDSPIGLDKTVSCSVPLSQTMTEEVASAFIACQTDQTCGVTETITPSFINEDPLTSGNCFSSARNAADLLKEENSKKSNGTDDPDRKKKRKKSKSRSGDKLAKSVNEDAGGNAHYISSARPHETGTYNVCSKKTTAVEMTFSRSPSEEVADVIIALTQSTMDDTGTDLLEASQSNGATMVEKNGKIRKKSKKSTAHDGDGSEALTLSNPKMKNPKGVINHDRKGLEKDALVVEHLTSRKTSAKNNRKVNHLEGKKSLLTKSGRIFKDASSDSSQDEDLIANSDAKDSTPDNSFSSDHSDKESKADLNLAQNGSNDLEKKLLGSRNIRETKCSSAAKGMTLDTILRRSSRYKKAKMTATELQLEDTDSQPVDIVPA